MLFLFKIENVLSISEKGIALIPGLKDNVNLVGSGKEIILKRPDNSIFKIKIKGISFEGEHNILLDSQMDKNQIPIGTEVWIAE